MPFSAEWKTGFVYGTRYVTHDGISEWMHDRYSPRAHQKMTASLYELNQEKCIQAHYYKRVVYHPRKGIAAKDPMLTDENLGFRIVLNRPQEKA